MNPIINPMFYYLVDICKTIRVLSLAFFLESGVVLIFMSIFTFGEYPYYNEEIKKYKYMRERMRTATIVMAISITLLLFVPSQATLYKMKLAKQTTVENVDKTLEHIDKAVDKILKK